MSHLLISVKALSCKNDSGGYICNVKGYVSVWSCGENEFETVILKGAKLLRCTFVHKLENKCHKMYKIIFVMSNSSILSQNYQ